MIRPNLGHMENEPYLDSGRMEPLQLGLLAAMCPPEVEVTLVDDRCEDIPYDQPVDLVGITVETFTARRAYQISDRFRRRGVPVVLGGFHPTLLPEEAAQQADSIVLGDAEGVWLEVLHDAKSGRLQPVYRVGRLKEASGIFPRRDLYKGKGYLPVTLTQFGRGCPHGCGFCALSAFFEKTHTHRVVEDVVSEIERQNRKLVFFVDDNIIADPAAAKTLFRALIPLHIRWVSQGSIDMVYDRELMDLMCESGCLGNVIGFESINPAALMAANKSPNFHSDNSYERELRILKEYGLQTWAAFTLGHDADTPESLYRMLDFALQQKFTFAAFNVLMPYPNTPFYRKLDSENRLLFGGHWWIHPEYRFNYAAFRPAKMSAKELTEISFEIRKKWNSTSAIFKRFFDRRTNMGSLYRMAIYWMYNPLFRRETFKKQGMLLGEFPG
ncbi:MAG: radical SAM protein [Acidobacteriota bacterium]